MRLLLTAAILAAAAVPAAAVTQINVTDVGPILNQSVALPAEATPGSSIPFAEFFEFSLPVSELVTVSMSTSGIGNLRIVNGTLSLNNHDTTGLPPLFIPGGTLIESTPITNRLGGQDAEVNPDVLSAGAYFAEITGTSGSSPINLAINGTATATVATPEISTWAMIALGLGFAMWRGKRMVGTPRLAI